jgi:hypothetical protein
MGTMANGVKHYSEILQRQVNNGTTTRHISVEENADGIDLVVYEVTPTKVKHGYTASHEVHPVLQKRFSTLKEGVCTAETVFDSGLRSGFYELIAETSVKRLNRV